MGILLQHTQSHILFTEGGLDIPDCLRCSFVCIGLQLLAVACCFVQLKLTGGAQISLHNPYGIAGDDHAAQRQDVSPQLKLGGSF